MSERLFLICATLAAAAAWVGVIFLVWTIGVIR